VLTRQLLAAGCHVTAVELDARLYHYLQTELANENPNLNLIKADAGKLNFDDIMGGHGYRCIANLPYAVSSVVIARFCERQNPPRELLVLLQQEMADRLAAQPRTKAYGALSVQVQLLYQVEVIRRLPSEVFYPPPEISSAYVRLCLRPAAERPPEQGLGAVRQLVRQGFAQRRKRLAKLLAGKWSKEAVATAFTELGIGDQVRAEELTPEQFRVLAEKIEGPKAGGSG
jgi:16S rRNA (adenine1518-N6/adenine1519-N6)-dimethyltransferase